MKNRVITRIGMYFVNIPLVLLLHYACSINGGYAIKNSSTSTRTQSREQERERERNERDLATLQEKWSITDNGVEFGGLAYTLKYITSDIIINSMMDATVYSIDCKKGGVIIPSSVMSVNLVPDNVPPGTGENQRDVNVDLVLAPDNLINSVAYNEVNDETGTTATIQFCMRFGLSTNGDTPIEVNFLETIITVSINLTSNFITNIDVASKEKILQTAEVTYRVEGFQCNRSNGRLSEIELSVARNQGAVIRLCVQPDQEARDQNIVMKSINSFVFNRNYGTTIGIVTQSAIEDGEAATNFLTELDCTEGSLVCAFETVLFSAMFMAPGSVTGSGEASMQFDTTRRKERILIRQQQQQQPYSSQREIQVVDNPIDKESKFGLDFELLPQLSYTDELIMRMSSTTKISVLCSFLAIGVTVSLLLLL